MPPRPPAILSSGVRLLTCPSRPTPIPSPKLFKCAFSTTPQSAAGLSNILGRLHNFKDAYGKLIRRGRGPSSGKGKTSGRGHKGQGQHGGVPEGVNGGQTKDEVVAGPYGFKNRNSVVMSPLNLSRLQEWIQAKRIDPTKPITFKELCESRCLHGIKDGVKLLARGSSTFTIPIHITVSRASSSAISAVEAAGGTVTTRFFNRQGILQTAYPHHFPEKMRLADATSRKDLEYYRNPEKRGYLSETLRPGDNPASLFFKNPEEAEKARNKKKRGQVKKQKATDKLW